MVLFTACYGITEICIKWMSGSDFPMKKILLHIYFYTYMNKLLLTANINRNSAIVCLKHVDNNACCHTCFVIVAVVQVYHILYDNSIAQILLPFPKSEFWKTFVHSALDSIIRHASAETLQYLITGRTIR